MIRFCPRRRHPAAVSGKDREAGHLKLFLKFLCHPRPQHADDRRQQLSMPAAQHLDEALVSFAGSRLPVKNLLDNLTSVLEPLCQRRAIGSGPKQGRRRQHPRLPFAPCTSPHTDKQRRRQKPVHNLPQNPMIDDDLLRRLPVLMRHPKLLLGSYELSEINNPYVA